MLRRTLIAALLAAAVPVTGRVHAAALAARLTPVEQRQVAAVQTYLNGIRTLKAHFLQVAPDGRLSQGTVWMQRPGRMRFQYDPPSPLLLVAGHGLVVFHDSSVDQTTNIPLGQTPLGILLARQISLSGDVTISAVHHLPGQLQLTLLRTASPGDGSLTLIFSTDPLTLRQWTVTDAQQRQTTVTLYNMETGGSFDQKLFEFVAPPPSRSHVGNG